MTYSILYQYKFRRLLDKYDKIKEVKEGVLFHAPKTNFFIFNFIMNIFKIRKQRKMNLILSLNFFAYACPNKYIFHKTTPGKNINVDLSNGAERFSHVNLQTFPGYRWGLKSSEEGVKLLSTFLEVIYFCLFR